MFDELRKYLGGNKSRSINEGTARKDHYDFVIEELGATDTEASNFLESDEYKEFRSSRFSLGAEADLVKAYDEFTDNNLEVV